MEKVDQSPSFDILGSPSNFQMNETLRQVLDSKDQVIAGLQSQMLKQKKMVDSTVQLRQENQKDLQAKQKDIQKLRQRVKEMQGLIDGKRKDPQQQQKIQLLRKQIQDRQKEYDFKFGQMSTMKNELHNVKDVNCLQENKKMIMLGKIEKHQADEDDADYLANKVEQSLEQIKGLREQQDKIQKMIDKKKAQLSISGQQSDQGKSLSLISKIVEYERKTQIINNSLQSGKISLEKMQYEALRLMGLNIIIQDKLIHTLGRQKSTSTGTLFYFFRHHANQARLIDIRENLEIQLAQNQQYCLSLQEQTLKIRSKQVDQVTDSDLSETSQQHCELESWLVILQSHLNQNQDDIGKASKLVHSMQEKVRVKCAKEVVERLKIAANENSDGVVRVRKVEETVFKFDSEIERLIKIGRLQYRKDDFKALKQILDAIKDASNELSSNFYISNLVIEKSKNASKGCDNLNITKLDKMLQSIRICEQSLNLDLVSLSDLERKVKDLQIKFNELIKQISQETHEHLVNQLNERSRQAQELQKKDKVLQNMIEGRKSDLYNIKNQIDDMPDQELHNQFTVNQLSLADAGGDEEQVQEQQRQIFNRTDTLMKQFKRMEPVGLQSFEQANELLEQLDEMDSFIAGTELKIEEGFQKATVLEDNLKEMERRLRNQRINDCEKAVKLDTESLEKLRRGIEKLSTTISIIQKDQTQLLNNDGFSDQEKRKEVASFALEIDKKEKQINQLIEAKDSFAKSIEKLEHDFQSALSENATNDGREYQVMKTLADRLKDDINRQVTQAEGEIHEDVTLCKEVNSKMVAKYKNKKERFTQCMDLRKLKLEEFNEWNEKLANYRDRESQLTTALLGLGVDQAGENAEMIKKFIAQIEKVKSQQVNIEKQLSHFSVRIREEASDLDVIGAKVVKTAKLEDIYKLLQEVKITCDPYDEIIEKVDLQLKNVEKDVEAFMIKTRSSQVYECEAKLKKLESNLEKLKAKILDVDNQIGEFNSELSECQSKVDNMQEIMDQVDVFSLRTEQSDLLKDRLQQQLKQLQEQLSKLDKKHLTVSECTQIFTDAQSLDTQCTSEFASMLDVEDQLRKLIARFRSQTQNEEERQKLIKIAKAKLKDNQGLMKQMKQFLVQNKEKAGDFDTIYKAMHESEDYQAKRPIVEKKMKRMQVLKQECGKLEQVKAEMEREGQVFQITEEDFDKIESLEELQDIIAQNEQVHQTLKVDVKELDDMHQGFEKRRRKIADAEIRTIAKKRKDELEKVRSALTQQMQKLNAFEEQILERQRDNTSAMSPEKQSHMQRTLLDLKAQFDEFKDQFERVDQEIVLVNQDIAHRDLERDEPLPKLAQDIERLRKTTFEVKDLKFEIEKIQIELQAKSTMLSSMDTEKKLKGLLQDLERSQANDEIVREALLRVKDISQAYTEGGYTSGHEDEEFCTVMYSESRDLLADFGTQAKTFVDLGLEVHKILESVDSKKDQSGGNLKSDDVEDLNEQIGRLEARLAKAKRARDEVEAAAMSNKERMASHEARQKLNRREQEMAELEKIVADINNDNMNMQNKIQTEIEACQGNAKYEQYVEKLINILGNTYKIQEKAQEVGKAKIEIDYDVGQAISELDSNSKDPNAHLDALETNILLKKRIQDTLKQISQIHALVKQVFNQTNDVFGKKPQEITYKPAQGDEIDKMLAEILNRLGINLPIKRLGGGYYMFGTKKIYCKIINGKLVVRVGGGYMGIEEFITQYGQSEMDKMNAQANVEAQLKEAQMKEAVNKKESSKQLKLNLAKPGTSQAMESPRTGRSAIEGMSIALGSGAQSVMNKAGSKSNFSQMSSDQLPKSSFLKQNTGKAPSSNTQSKK